MGSFGGTKGSSASQTTETAMSREQTAILKQRQDQFNQFFFPELVSELQATNVQGRTTVAAQQGARDVNRAAQSATRDFRQGMAQRGLANSGVATLGEAELGRARSSALADAMYRAREANTARRMQLIQMGGSMAPTPTSAAGFGQVSTQQNQTKGWLEALGIK